MVHLAPARLCMLFVIALGSGSSVIARKSAAAGTLMSPLYKEWPDDRDAESQSNTETQRHKDRRTARHREAERQPGTETKTE